ncbi:MAG TPA: VOC family protein [Candidatus Limnocylindria bacterium]|nr:VOC family protein [Candidatus Limnocylindria bacterium]
MAIDSRTENEKSTGGTRVQKITPYFWFDDQAEEAAKFYVSIFKNSRVRSVTRDPVGVGGQQGRVMVVDFQLEGQNFIALNGGPQFKFTEAISLFVTCETQAEVDELWKKLTSDGGEESQCGWLKDKYGLSWQIIPRQLMEMMQDRDPAKAKRVTEAMLQMRKIDIAGLKSAYDQR